MERSAFGDSVIHRKVLNNKASYHVGDDAVNTLEDGRRQRHHVHHHQHDHRRLTETSKNLLDEASIVLKTPHIGSGGSAVTTERRTRYDINFFILMY